MGSSSPGSGDWGYARRDGISGRQVSRAGREGRGRWAGRELWGPQVLPSSLHRALARLCPFLLQPQRCLSMCSLRSDTLPSLSSCHTCTHTEIHMHIQTHMHAHRHRHTHTHSLPLSPLEAGQPGSCSALSYLLTPSRLRSLCSTPHPHASYFLDETCHTCAKSL